MQPQIKSTHFVGLRSSKDYYKPPGGVAGVYGKGQLGVSFDAGRCVLREWVARGGGLDGYFWASRGVLKDFTEDALTILAGSLFQNGTARIVKANW